MVKRNGERIEKLEMRLMETFYSKTDTEDSVQCDVNERRKKVEYNCAPHNTIKVYHFCYLVNLGCESRTRTPQNMLKLKIFFGYVSVWANFKHFEMSESSSILLFLLCVFVGLLPISMCFYAISSQHLKFFMNRSSSSFFYLFPCHFNISVDPIISIWN